jgi:aspartate carbamoyltransferase catalytic subunit
LQKRLHSNTNREIPVINAGSGADQHPTQALLDIYTLERSFESNKGIDNKIILFSGDLKRGRTVRSLAWLLTLYNNVKIIFSAPHELQIKSDILEMLDKAQLNYVVSENFSEHLSEVDAIYMTRLQDEWDNDNDTNEIDRKKFQIDSSHLKKLKKDAIIMHPLPRREEISTSIDNSPQAMYWRQMRNGMWIRAALILKTFDRENKIYDWEN